MPRVQFLTPFQPSVGDLDAHKGFFIAMIYPDVLSSVEGVDTLPLGRFHVAAVVVVFHTAVGVFIDEAFLHAGVEQIAKELNSTWYKVKKEDRNVVITMN